MDLYTSMSYLALHPALIELLSLLKTTCWQFKKTIMLMELIA